MADKRRVLSASPFIYKGAPLVLVVGLGAFFAFASGQHTDPNGLVLLALLLVAGFVAMRMAAPDFADKVSDGGDHLLIRFGREEERIAFGQIERVHEPHRAQPTRIELHLRHPGKFGAVITFIPKGFFAQMSFD